MCPDCGNLHVWQTRIYMSALAGLGGDRRPLPSGTDGDQGDLRSLPSGIGGDHGDLRARPSGIGGDPTAEDLAKAKDIVSPDETILGVYRIAEGRDVDIAVLRDCVPHNGVCLFPLFAPFLLASYPAQRGWYRATLWIVTTTHIHRRAEPTDSVCDSVPRNFFCCRGWGPSTNASAPLYTVSNVTDELPCSLCFYFKPSAAVLHLPNNAPLANNWVHNDKERVLPHLALIHTADPVDLIALIRRAQDGQPAKDFAASQTFQDRTENLMPMAANLMGGMMGGMGGMGGVQMQAQMQAMQGVGAGAGMAAPPMATGQVILEQTMDRDPAEKSIVEKLSELTALRDASIYRDVSCECRVYLSQ